MQKQENMLFARSPALSFFYFFVGLKCLINPLNVVDDNAPVSSNLNPLFIQSP